MLVATSERARVAILGLDRHFEREHRIRNELLSLSSLYEVDGYGNNGVGGVADFTVVRHPPKWLYRMVKLGGAVLPRLRIGFERWWYRSVAAALRNRRYRFLVPHNIPDGLVAVSSGVPFVFHAHEYLPRQFDGSLWFRLTEIRYRRTALSRILPQTALTVVEGHKVAVGLATAFGMPRGRFHVMPSMPAYRPTVAINSTIGPVIRLVHHGLLVPQRGLELLIAVAGCLGPDYHLTLMGPGQADYLRRLSGAGNGQDNVTFKEPVAYERIVESLHGEDLGLIVFGSPHYHHKYMTVPNKFWECLQARVPVLVSPESGMADYVRESGCGIVASDASLEGYVEAIRSMTKEQLVAMKRECDRRAYRHSRDSWLEEYSRTLTDAVTRQASSVGAGGLSA